MYVIDERQKTMHPVDAGQIRFPLSIPISVEGHIVCYVFIDHLPHHGEMLTLPFYDARLVEADANAVRTLPAQETICVRCTLAFTNVEEVIDSHMCCTGLLIDIVPVTAQDVAKLRRMKEHLRLTR